MLTTTNIFHLSIFIHPRELVQIAVRDFGAYLKSLLLTHEVRDFTLSEALAKRTLDCADAAEEASMLDRTSSVIQVNKIPINDKANSQY